MTLSKRHKKELKTASAIGKEVIRDRGYRTIEDADDLEVLGFKRKQRRVPGLLVPMFDTSGQNGLYQFKPDKPRTVQGKTVKYETPAGSHVRLDCPPAVLERLKDPSTDLWITEGVKKADSAVTVGLACIALSGVDCWRNKEGPLPEWDNIALTGRQVYIAYDSDVMTKDSVKTALDSLTRFLRLRGATVKWIVLPDRKGLAGSSKQGLDDYFAEGGSPTDLIASAVSPGFAIRAENQQARELTRDAVAAMSANNEPPVFFKRDTNLLYAGATGVASVDKDRLRYLLGEVADWYVIRKAGKEFVRRPVEPPVSVVSNVINAYELWPFPTLDRIVTTPVFARDGTLRTAPGYHPASRSLYLPPEGLVVPAVPDTPTKKDVKRAKGLINELFQDFVFVEKSDKAHAVAMLLQPFARELIWGSTPMFGVEAPKQGTGKTLLVQSALAPAAGQVDSYAEPHGNEEMDKVITASLINAMPVLFFDNVERYVRYPALASALTKPTWTGRVLGQSATRTIPVTCTFVLTANNPRYSDDMVRRVLRIRLDALTEDPSQRKNFALSLPSWALQNRGDLIWAACVLIRSWVAAGRPEPGKSVPNLGSYGPWRRVIGGVLEHAGFKGFLGNVTEVRESTPDQETFEALGEIAVEAFGDTWFYAKDLAELAWASEVEMPSIRSNSPEQMAKEIGYFLRSHKDQVLSGNRLVRSSSRGGSGYPWRFEARKG